MSRFPRARSSNCLRLMNRFSSRWLMNLWLAVDGWRSPAIIAIRTSVGVHCSASATSVMLNSNSSVMWRGFHGADASATYSSQLGITMASDDLPHEQSLQEVIMSTNRLSWVSRKPTKRALLGLVLIAVSVAGTAVTIAVGNEGTTAVVATRMIVSGSTIAEDDVRSVKISPTGSAPTVTLESVVGQRAATDIVQGSTIVSANLDDTFYDKLVLSVPLGLVPAESVAEGARIRLWAIAPDQSAPVRLVARDVIVVGMRESGFGGEVTADVSLNDREAQNVLAALGANSMIVATTGGSP